MGSAKRDWRWKPPALVADAERGSPFVHGVYLVLLAAVPPREPLADLLSTTIADALRLPLSGAEPPLTQLLNYLREKSVLLVFDNFEHVLTAATLVTTLLAGASRLTVVVTSRERLAVDGEYIVDLDGLPFPPADAPEAADRAGQYDAVRLFTERARAIAPGFVLAPRDLPAVTRICRLVAGVPLGIELAASWSRLLSVDEIAAELAQNLDFLHPTIQDVPARHRGLRAVFDYSWNLLDAAEQQTLRRLAVFPGPFTRAAAAATAGATLASLASLVDKSLARRVASTDGTGVRYDMLDLVRQFAVRRLDEAGETEAYTARHAAYYLDALARRTADLRGAGQQAALKELAVDVEHIRAAWRRAVERADHAALDAAADSLFHFYDMQSWFGEGAEAFTTASHALRAVDDQDDPARVRARLQARQAWFIFYLGRQREARALLDESLARLRALDARADLVFTLNYLASVCSYLGEHQRTAELCQENLALTAAIDDHYGRAVTCNILGQSSFDRGDYAAARQCCLESLAIEEHIGNRWSMAFSLTTLGKVAYATAGYGEAQRLFEQALQIREELGDLRGEATCFDLLADTALELGDYAAAGRRYAHSLVLSREVGDQWAAAGSLLRLGRLATFRRRHAAASCLLGEALRMALATGALPRVIAVAAAFAGLLRQIGETAWAADLDQALAAQPSSVDPLQAQLIRLRGWSSAGGALTLEQAIAAIKDGAAASEDSERAATRPPKYPAGLTAREIDVLQLVAEGLSDKEIAERLILSVRTVSTHLTSIYGKLEVKSRSAATRFALEHGLR